MKANKIFPPLIRGKEARKAFRQDRGLYEKEALTLGVAASHFKDGCFTLEKDKTDREGLGEVMEKVKIFLRSNRTIPNVMVGSIDTFAKLAEIASLDLEWQKGIMLGGCTMARNPDMLGGLIFVTNDNYAWCFPNTDGGWNYEWGWQGSSEIPAVACVTIEALLC